MENVQMENSIIHSNNWENQRISTMDVIKSMEIGDYFKLDKLWIQITEKHVQFAKKYFLDS